MITHKPDHKDAGSANTVSAPEPFFVQTPVKVVSGYYER